jgi:hypothetical protein
MRMLASLYVLLVAVCIVVPYLAGIRPRTRTHWRYLAITIGFLSWLLLGLAVARAAPATG